MQQDAKPQHQPATEGGAVPAADEGGAVAVNARRTRVARLAEQLQPSAFGVGEQVLLEASWPYLPASHLACVRIIGPELQLADVAV